MGEVRLNQWILEQEAKSSAIIKSKRKIW